MTIKELREIIKDYPDDSFVHMRIWLQPHLDYLDDGLVQAVVDKSKCDVSGALLLIGTDTKHGS